MMPHNEPQDCTNSAQPQEVTASNSDTEKPQPQAYQGVIRWEWNPQRERAAQLVAEDHTEYTAICQTLNITYETLRSWRLTPAFQERVERIRRKLANYAERLLIGRKAYRIGNLQRRLLAMEQVIEERAQQEHMQQVAGGKTGLLVRKLKSVGHGENAQVVEEYEFDAALVKEMREHEKQAAIECGQWTEKREVSGDGTGPVVVKVVEKIRQVIDNEQPGPGTDDRAAPDSVPILPQ